MLTVDNGHYRSRYICSDCVGSCGGTSIDYYRYLVTSSNKHCGTSTYTFTIDAGQCAFTTMDVDITAPTTPPQLLRLRLYVNTSALARLPTTSR